MDWKYTGKLDKIFSRDFEIWIFILLKIYITQKNKMAEFKMVEFNTAAINQVEWEWMSFSQIELVWVRVRVEWERFWVNLREENKVSESNMVEAESKMAEFKMATIIKVNDNEWILSQIKLVWVRVRVEWECFWVNLRERKQGVWIQHGRIQDGYHHQVEWEWMSLSQIELVWVRIKVEGVCFWVNLREDKQGIWIQDGSV